MGWPLPRYRSRLAAGKGRLPRSGEMVFACSSVTFMRSVSCEPGHAMLTVMPRSNRSWAAVFVHAHSAVRATFDMANDAKVIFGPAARNLPQLELDVDADGYFIAKTDYRHPVGPSFWERG